MYQYNRDRRTARRLGARLPPVADGSTIGNTALFDRLTVAWKTGYPGELDFASVLQIEMLIGNVGDVFWDLEKECGKTYNLRIMFEDVIYTTEPQNVKRILATEFDNFVKGAFMPFLHL